MITRKKKFFALSLALVFVSCLLFAGCGRDQNMQNGASDNKQVPPTQNQTGMNGTTTDMNTNRMSTSINDTENATLHARAEKIADAIVNDIAAVKDARVIISDKMAYVSVSIPETADASAAKTLKEEIGTIVKKTDSQIEDVYVMEDADTFTRMKEMVHDIANGHPISSFTSELNNMFARVLPSKE